MARFVLLLRQLEAEGYSQREIAKRLDISQGAVSAYLTGVRQPGRVAIGKATQALRLSPVFFWDRALGEPDYRDFQAPDLDARMVRPTPPAWANIDASGRLDHYRKQGVTDAQIDAVRRFPWTSAPEERDIERMLDAVLLSVNRPRS